MQNVAPGTLTLFCHLSNVSRHRRTPSRCGSVHRFQYVVNRDDVGWDIAPRLGLHAGPSCADDDFQRVVSAEASAPPQRSSCSSYAANTLPIPPAPISRRSRKPTHSRCPQSTTRDSSPGRGIACRRIKRGCRASRLPQLCVALFFQEIPPLSKVSTAPGVNAVCPVRACGLWQSVANCIQEKHKREQVFVTDMKRNAENRAQIVVAAHSHAASDTKPHMLSLQVRNSVRSPDSSICAQRTGSDSYAVQ